MVQGMIKSVVWGDDGVMVLTLRPVGQVSPEPTQNFYPYAELPIFIRTRSRRAAKLKDFWGESGEGSGAGGARASVLNGNACCPAHV